MADELVYYPKLRTQHRLYVDEYCTGAKSGKPYNVIAAAEAAGYAHPKIYGSQLKRRPDIRQAIEEILSTMVMSKGELLKRFQDIAESDIGDVLDPDPVTGQLKINMEKLNKKKRFLKSFGYDSNGNPKYEFHDSHAAMRDLAKAIGVIGPEGTGGTVNVIMNINFIRPGEAPDQLPAKASEEVPEAEWEEDEG